ncbi:hypothetical protein E2C01_067863 [Portunus trituberculatus]|uniref:Uncharacterized protein n=1 Tax=Portunus trituberculatus TaxID=210409 RepID=A0A5B7HM72_PORTR|nr:hypothetical protein [Portunus trituberculatus]
MTRKQDLRGQGGKYPHRGREQRVINVTWHHHFSPQITAPRTTTPRQAAAAASLDALIPPPPSLPLHLSHGDVGRTCKELCLICLPAQGSTGRVSYLEQEGRKTKKTRTTRTRKKIMSVTLFFL